MWPDNPDDVARLFYLLILLLGVLGFFAIGARQRLGATLQQLLIWALIFAMVIIAYGFRDTLTGQLFPGRTTSAPGGGIEIGRASDGHFHATLRVNGAPVRFIVDTGASEVVLSREDAERVGIDPARLAYDGRAVTANGTVATARVMLDEVAFGDRIERRVPAAVTAGELPFSLLGLTFLDRFARIEIEGDRMRLAY